MEQETSVDAIGGSDNATETRTETFESGNDREDRSGAHMSAAMDRAEKDHKASDKSEKVSSSLGAAEKTHHTNPSEGLTINHNDDAETAGDETRERTAKSLTTLAADDTKVEAELVQVQHSTSGVIEEKPEETPKPAPTDEDRKAKIAELDTSIAGIVQGDVTPAEADKLDQTLREQLELKTTGMATPSDALESWAAEMKALNPEDKELAAIVDRVSADKQRDWAASGRVHDVFDPLNTIVSTAKNDPAGWTPELKTKFKDTVTGQFATAAKLNPTVEAVKSHAELLKTYMPEQAPLIDAALKEFTVDGPQRIAAEIAATLKTEGPEAAAAALAKATHPNSVDPLTAGLITREAKPSITAIADTLVGRWNEAIKGYSSFVDTSAIVSARDQFVEENAQLYRDLSASLDSASRSPLGKQAVTDVAEKIVGSITAIDHRGQVINFADEQFVSALGSLTTDGIEKGAGAALSFELAAQLSAVGQTKSAETIVDSIKLGASRLQAVTQSAVDKFIKDYEVILSPQQALSPYISQENLDAAEKAFLEKNPELARTISGHLATLNKHGYEITRLAVLTDEYAAKLDSLPNYSALVDQTTSLLKDPKTQAATLLSVSGTAETARAFASDMIKSGLVDPKSAIYSLIGPSGTIPIDHSRNIRAIRNAAMKTYNAGIPGPALSDKESKLRRSAFDPGTRLGIGSGLLGTAMYTWGMFNQFDKYQDALAKGKPSAYISGALTLNYAFGLTVEGIQAGVGAYANARKLNGLPEEKIQSLKMGLDRFAARTATRTGVMNTLYGNVRNFSTGINVAGTVVYLAEGDYLRAGAYGATTAGQLLSSFAKGFDPIKIGGRQITAAALQAFGTWFSLGGGVALVSIDMYQNHQDKVKRAERLQASTEAFAQELGLRPDVTKAISRYDLNGVAAIERLTALAHRQGITPQEMLDWLNKQSPEFVEKFVNDGLLEVPRTSTGEFAPWIETPTIARGVSYEGDVYAQIGYDPAKAGLDLYDPKTWAMSVTSPKARSLKGLEILATLLGHPLPTANVP